MKPLTLNNANELAAELTQMDGQTRYVCKVGPDQYIIQTEHQVDFKIG